MAQQQNETRLNVEYIPPNFKEGFSVLGFMFKFSYVIQAVPFIAVVVIILLAIGPVLGVITKLIIGVVFCLPAVIISATGINGDSLFGYLRCLIRARKNRQTYIYNPRPKSELKPITDDFAVREMLPREKIMLYMEKKRAGKDQKKHYDELVLDNMYFEDDDGFIDKPYEYMNSKERRQYHKTNKH